MLRDQYLNDYDALYSCKQVHVGRLIVQNVV